MSTYSHLTSRLRRPLVALVLGMLLLPAAGLADLPVLDRGGLARAIRDTDEVLVVELTASWCVNCKLAARRVSALRESFEGGVSLAQVDVGRHASVLSKYEIEAVPAVLVFRGGREVARHIGVPSPEWLQATVAGNGGQQRLPRLGDPVLVDGARVAQADTSAAAEARRAGAK